MPSPTLGPTYCVAGSHCIQPRSLLNTFVQPPSSLSCTVSNANMLFKAAQFHVYLLAQINIALTSAFLSPRAICSGFTTESQPYTIPGPSSYIVSAGVVCTGTRPCAVLPRGFITADRMLSLSVTPDTADDIFSLISPVVDFEFPESLTGNVSSSTWQIGNGTSGHLGFTPNFRCVTGTLNGCTTQGLQNGTVVDACTPFYATQAPSIDGIMKELSGTVSVVTTDQAGAVALICNPADTTQPEDAPNATCRGDTNIVPSSLAAGRSTIQGGIICFSLLIGLCWTGGPL